MTPTVLGLLIFGAIVLVGVLHYVAEEEEVNDDA